MAFCFWGTDVKAMQSGYVLRHWSGAAGLMVGLWLLPVISHEWQDWTEARRVSKERNTPVVETTGTVVSRDHDSVVLLLKGRKLRECKFLGLQAYTTDPDGALRSADIARIGTERGETRPVGPLNAGEWRIWPIGATPTNVIVHSLHLCDGVEVRSLMAMVALDDDTG